MFGTTNTDPFEGSCDRCGAPVSAPVCVTDVSGLADHSWGCSEAEEWFFCFSCFVSWTHARQT